MSLSENTPFSAKWVFQKNPSGILLLLPAYFHAFEYEKKFVSEIRDLSGLRFSDISDNYRHDIVGQDNKVFQNLLSEDPKVY